MVDIPTKTREFGVWVEATYDTDGILTTVNDTNNLLHKMGWLTIPINIPSYKVESYVVYLPYSNKEGQSSYISIKRLEFACVVQMINLLPFYYILGSSSTTTNIHTITPVAVGTSKPSLTVRYRWDTDNTDFDASDVHQIKHITGSKLVSLTIGMDVLTDKKPTLTCVFRGTTINEPVTAALAVGGGSVGTVKPEFPTGGSTNIFNRTLAATWDYNTVEAQRDIAKFIAAFSIQINDNYKEIEPEVDSLTSTEFEDGELVYLLNLKLFRGGTLELIDYCNNFTNATTRKDLYIKLQYDSTHYVEFVMIGIYPNPGVVMKSTVKQSEFDEFQFGFTGLSVIGKDGLTASTYYGE